MCILQKWSRESRKTSQVSSQDLLRLSSAQYSARWKDTLFQMSTSFFFFFFIRKSTIYIPEYVREVVAGPGCSADLKGLGVYADKARHNAVKPCREEEEGK